MKTFTRDEIAEKQEKFDAELKQYGLCFYDVSGLRVASDMYSDDLYASECSGEEGAECLLGWMDGVLEQYNLSSLAEKAEEDRISELEDEGVEFGESNHYYLEKDEKFSEKMLEKIAEEIGTLYLLEDEEEEDIKLGENTMTKNKLKFISAEKIDEESVRVTYYHIERAQEFSVTLVKDINDYCCTYDFESTCDSSDSELSDIIVEAINFGAGDIDDDCSLFEEMRDTFDSSKCEEVILSATETEAGRG